MKKTFTVVYEGTVHEIYTVVAESEEEARAIWSEEEPDSSEVIDGEVIEVIEVREQA